MDDEVRRIFKYFHKNRDMKISRTELKEMMLALGSKMTSEEINHMMEKVNQNDYGYFDMKEFGEIHTDGGDALEIQEAFEMYNLEKNGPISAKELHTVMTSSMAFEDAGMFGDMHNVEYRKIKLELK